MLYFVCVMLLWFLVSLCYRIVSTELVSEPYRLNEILLNATEPGSDPKIGYASIQPEEDWSIDEDEVRRVLKASKELSRSKAN